MRLTRPAGVGLGLAMIWFSMLALLPLIAVVVETADAGWTHFVTTVTEPQTYAALTLTVVTALIITIINTVMGTMIAWVLVRDRFPGRRVLEVVIDIPFALPTIVAGLVLLSLYGPQSPLGINIANTRIAVGLAFLFVTLPFVVRTVQPVLADMDRDVEQAAASLGPPRGHLAAYRLADVVSGDGGWGRHVFCPCAQRVWRVGAFIREFTDAH